VKKSLVLLFGMYALLVALSWGLLEKRYIAVTAVLMWGVGDGAAAIFGRTFGRHKTGLRHADENKTREGTTAMLVFAFLAGAAGMLIAGVGEWWRIVFYPLIAAPFAAYTELVTKNGDDTVTVPLVTAAVIAALSFIF
jgi:phytol kinase